MRFAWVLVAIVLCVIVVAVLEAVLIGAVQVVAVIFVAAILVLPRRRATISLPSLASPKLIFAGLAQFPNQLGEEIPHNRPLHGGVL